MMTIIMKIEPNVLGLDCKRLSSTFSFTVHGDFRIDFQCRMLELKNWKGSESTSTETSIMHTLEKQSSLDDGKQECVRSEVMPRAGEADVYYLLTHFLFVGSRSCALRQTETPSAQQECT